VIRPFSELGKFGLKIDGIGTTPLDGDMRMDRHATHGPPRKLQTSVESRILGLLRTRGRRGGKSPRRGRGQYRAGAGVAGVDASASAGGSPGGLKDADRRADQAGRIGLRTTVSNIEPEEPARGLVISAFERAHRPEWPEHRPRPQHSDVERVSRSHARAGARHAEFFDDPRGCTVLLGPRTARSCSRLDGR